MLRVSGDRHGGQTPAFGSSTSRLSTLALRRIHVGGQLRIHASLSEIAIVRAARVKGNERSPWPQQEARSCAEVVVLA